MSTRKEQLLRRAAGKKGRRVALTREEKSLRDFLEKIGDGSAGGPKITNFAYFCYNGVRLDTIANIDTSNGTDFSCMFEQAGSSLTTIPELDTSNGTNFTSMFMSCGSLASIPELDTSNGTYFSNMFNNCKKLTSVPKIDLNKNTRNSKMFYYCTALANLYIYNVRSSIQIGSGTIWGHLLTVDSLVHTIQELCTVTVTQTLTIGNENLAKIADLYCRIIDDTVEKKTMELCESTDDGAMTLADYASLKGWEFA